jgi:hypothetical protein
MMAQIGSFALLFALACSAYCLIGGVIPLSTRWLLPRLLLKRPCARAVANLSYVFCLPRTVFVGPVTTRAGYLREHKKAVCENLRDLNFEFAAGKVPVADYTSLKSFLQAKPPTYWPNSRAWITILRRQLAGAPKFERSTRAENTIAYNPERALFQRAIAARPRDCAANRHKQ